MNIRPTLRRGVIAAAIAVSSLPASAQTQPASSDDRLRKLEERFEQMEKDLKARDAEIARLRSELNTRDPKEVAPPTTQPDPAEKTRQDVQADAEKRQADPFSLRTPASFNPSIAVVSDFVANYSSNRNNDALNRVDVREVHLDFRSAISRSADGVVILAFERDAENPVFPEGEPLEGPEGSVNIEEAYLHLHDFGVPNLTAKVGRFNVRFGRQNMLHLHDLPTSDPPLVNQAPAPIRRPSA